MIWEPPREFIENTNVWRFMQRLGFADREAFLRFSREKPERFWDEMMREMRVEWFEPYRQVLDMSRGPEWAQWFIGGRLNIAHNCLDRWADSDRIACIWEAENGDVRRVTFAELRNEANRVANGLLALGLEPGDRVALCMPMVPEILAILYGCFKAGLTVVPIFAGFGSAAIATRLEDSGARVLFTADHLERRGKRLPLLEKTPKDRRAHDRCRRPPFSRSVRRSSPPLPLESEARAFILYTSGTTGKPKGAVHTHAGCLAQMGKEIWLGFDHRPDDIFFWLSDIGWMMGPWTIIGNHLFGGTIFLYDGAPDYPGPMRLWDIDRASRHHHLRHLPDRHPPAPQKRRRFAADALAAPPRIHRRALGRSGLAVVLRARRASAAARSSTSRAAPRSSAPSCFPLPIQPLKPCSLGGPAPGMATEVVDETGAPVRGRTGYLVCTKPAPSMTRGIWNDPERYIDTYWSRFPGMWNHGDWASVDEDGHWFRARPRR